MKAYEDLVQAGDGIPEKLGADGEPLASAAHRAPRSCREIYLRSCEG